MEQARIEHAPNGSLLTYIQGTLKSSSYLQQSRLVWVLEHALIQRGLCEGVQIFCLFVCLFFLVDEGKGGSKYHYKRAIMCPLAKAADDSPTLNAGLLASWFFRGSGPDSLRNPIFLWFFRELIPGSAHEEQLFRELAHMWIDFVKHMKPRSASASEEG